MSKVSKIVAGAAVLPVLAMAAPVFADSPGTFGTAPDEYLVKNLTQNGSYGTTASASACDELKYSIRLDNVAYGQISDINVKATLPSAEATSNKSNLTASGKNAAGNTTTTSGSVTVNLSSAQTVAYEAGSTQLFDSGDKLIKTLPDGINANGVNIGNLAGSATEFVTFKAKVNCPTTPTPPVTPPTTPPTVLPNTGAGNVIGIVAGAIVAGFIASRLYLSRRLSR